jgi:N-formylglutamate amidohydrolase
MYPIIISAPHSRTFIKDKKLRSRFALTDHEIWKCSDPFTSNLSEFTCSKHKFRSNVHRLICDLNRAPDAKDVFRAYDFFGRKAIKDTAEFTSQERERFLEKYWYPFHGKIIERVRELSDKGHKKILLIDYHNTSGDHPLTHERAYMPSIVISNLGARNTGERHARRKNTSIPGKYLQMLKQDIESHLNIGVELNQVYRGGYNVYWFSHVIQQKYEVPARLYAVQIEYNLDFVVNPISNKVDREALHILQKGLNKALVRLYKELPE